MRTIVFENGVYWVEVSSIQAGSALEEMGWSKDKTSSDIELTRYVTHDAELARATAKKYRWKFPE